MTFYGKAFDTYCSIARSRKIISELGSTTGSNPPCAHDSTAGTLAQLEVGGVDEADGGTASYGGEWKSNPKREDRIRC